MGTDVEVRSFLIWSENRPSPQEREILKRAKLSSGVKFNIVPRKAFVGCGGRVLAVGIRPHWLTDYAFVESWLDKNVDKAIKWVLLGDDVLGEIPGPTRVIDQLRDILGPGVREITNELSEQDNHQLRRGPVFQEG